MLDFRKHILIALTLILSFSLLAAERTTYSITPVTGFPGAHSTKVNALNNSGQVVGASGNHAFLWEHGTMTDLGTLGGDLSVAHGINDLGQIVGESSTAAGETHAFLWERGVMTDLGIPGENSSAHGINNRGEIVGSSFAKNVRGGALLWRSRQRHLLGDLDLSGSGSTAISINNQGEIVGVSSGFSENRGVVRAVLWQRGSIRDLGTIGGLHSTANGLSDRGEIVGWSDIADQSTVAFVWVGNSMHDLGSLPGSAAQPGTGSQANGINESGQVVGSSLSANGVVRAVIWENGKISDLNELIPAGNGTIFTRATAINSHGQIIVEQETSPDGSTLSFLLTPVRRGRP